MTSQGKKISCAIYTRVSTDAGLEQDFNSLDAQYEGASAYIKSQAHAGWIQLRQRYDDGGFSGGSTERPALQQLLSDIQDGRIDIIVVYKVDRLTRSLADFAKLVELFDKHGVSFVSVTQQFNTTTSMGRLTLNVLLSFAQFEREVTSERIRDKIAAAKRKGLWMGGTVPLGYRLENHKIKIEEREAKIVRHLFQRYLKLKSQRSLITELREAGIKTRSRRLPNGKIVGGIPFMRGPIAYLLSNRFYVGEITHKGEILKGEHAAIIDRTLFDEVQGIQRAQRNSHAAKMEKSDALLIGLIYDDKRHRMTPVIAKKNGRQYRYYISSALHQGKAEEAGSVTRVAADQVENALVKAIKARSAKDGKLSEARDESDRELLRSRIERVKISKDLITVILHKAGPDLEDGTILSDRTIVIPWKKRPAKMPREIMLPANNSKSSRPIRSENRARLVSAIANSRTWIAQLEKGEAGSIQDIADREKLSVRQINRVLTLAFLSPRLVEAAVEGRLPRGVGLASIRELPAAWSKQHEVLGLKF